MTYLEQIAAYLNTSRTGCVATVVGECVSVEVPGLLSLSGGKTAPCFTTEKVYTMPQAIRLVMSMQ